VEIRNPEAVDADVDTMQVSKADVVVPTKVGFQCCVTKQHEGYGLACNYSRVKGILFGENMLHFECAVYDEAHRLTSVLSESTDRRGNRQIKGLDQQMSTTPQV